MICPVLVSKKTVNMERALKQNYIALSDQITDNIRRIKEQFAEINHTFKFSHLLSINSDYIFEHKLDNLGKRKWNQQHHRGGRRQIIKLHPLRSCPNWLSLEMNGL